MKLSIVTTLYHSGDSIEEFYRRSSQAALQYAGEYYEIVIVNDGSPDHSLGIAMRLAEHDGHVIVIDLSRNFGHHKAMMTGLAHASGENIFLIDSDLEEEPEWLNNFSDLMADKHCDVVYGVQERRKGEFFERWSGLLFYWLFKALTKIELPENLTTARFMSRRYVDALLRHGEREIFIAGLWHITGFDQFPIKVKKHDHSSTTYTFKKKMGTLVNSVTSFSNAPLIMIFYTGVAIFAFACVYSGYLVVYRIFLAKPLSGWTSVMASIWLLGGLVISFIGVIGLYLSKIFSETKQRPYTIVRAVHRKSQAEMSTLSNEFVNDINMYGRHDAKNETVL